MTVLIVYFTADSCKSDSCRKYETCRSLNGFEFVCDSTCDAVLCCEDGPNALCCENGGICSNINFVFNGTNTDECQCLCDDNFRGFI